MGSPAASAEVLPSSAQGVAGQVEDGAGARLPAAVGLRVRVVELVEQAAPLID